VVGGPSVTGSQTALASGRPRMRTAVVVASPGVREHDYGLRISPHRGERSSDY
jgi:hypothetical protein